MATTYYRVKNLAKDGEETTKTDFKELYNKTKAGNESYAEWLEEFLGSKFAQRLLKIEVREATAEEVQNMGGLVKVLTARDAAVTAEAAFADAKAKILNEALEFLSSGEVQTAKQLTEVTSVSQRVNIVALRNGIVAQRKTFTMPDKVLELVWEQYTGGNKGAKLKGEGALAQAKLELNPSKADADAVDEADAELNKTAEVEPEVVTPGSVA